MNIETSILQQNNQERPPFTEAEILRDLEKYGLLDKELVITKILNQGNIKQQKSINVENLVKMVFENQDTGNGDERLDSSLPNKILEQSNLKTLIEIKNDLLKYNLPNDMRDMLAKAIRDAQSEKQSFDPSISVRPVETSPVLEEENNDIEIEKSKEGVMEELLIDSKFIHFLAGTNRGFRVYRVFQGGEDLKVSDTGENNLDIELPDLQGYSSVQKDALLGSNSNPNWSEARLANKEFAQGNGYGLVFPKLDDLGRLGFGSYWVIIPKEDFKMQTYIKDHPEILLDLFRQKINKKSGISIFEEKFGPIHLRDSKFVDANK